MHSRRLNASVPVRKLQDPQRVFISRTTMRGIRPPGQSAANSGKKVSHSAVIRALATAGSGRGAASSAAWRAAARAWAAATQPACEATKASTVPAGTRGAAEAATLPSARTRRLMLRTRRRVSV